MRNRSGDQFLRNFASPYGLAGISFFVFFIAWLMPPSIYSPVMSERDILFLNPPTFFFYTLCVLGFIFGVWITYPREVPLYVPRLSPRIPATLFLVLPLLAGLLMTTGAILQMFKQVPNLLVLIAAQQGQSIKGGILLDAQDHLAVTAPILVGLSWWALWRFWQLSLTGWRAWCVRLMLLTTILAIVGSSVLLVFRFPIMETIAGIFLLYLLHREAEGRLSWTVIAGMCGIFVTGLIVLFGAFAFIRGTSSLDMQFQLLIGYTIASYNRLAALITGTLHYSYSGRGIRLSDFVAFNKTFHHLLPVDRIFNWPSERDFWTLEFGNVERAGLNGGLIWPGAFGYIFSDLGWFSPLWLILYGMAYGVAWKAMRSSSAAGVFIYPYFGFCVLFWVGSNMLLASSLVPFVKYAIYLTIYEKLLLMKTKDAEIALTL
jgi:hypothetical protein